METEDEKLLSADLASVLFSSLLKLTLIFHIFPNVANDFFVLYFFPMKRGTILTHSICGNNLLFSYSIEIILAYPIQVLPYL